MEAVAVRNENLVGATLLIAGCCIGAGMIGLPVVSALSGLIPSTLALLLCYCFATATGLLLLEATLWFEGKVNLLTLSTFALGAVGKLVTGALYLFLFYCLFIAYIDCGGQLFQGFLSFILPSPASRELGILSCVAFVVVCVYAGIHIVSKVNRVFMVGLVAAYFSLLFFGISHVNPSHFAQMDFKAILTTIPVMLVCFGYQNMIPTLVHYVKRNVPILRTAILIGNMIPFIIYFLWNMVILGMLPSAGTSSMEHLVGESEMVAGLLQKASQSQMVLIAVNAFSFFALFTSFMGNAITFGDFLKDGIKSLNRASLKPLVNMLVFVPPTILTLIYPKLFLKALGLVGGFVDVILFGIIPVIIVAVGRYIKKIDGPYQVAGGKPFLCLIFLLSLGLLILNK